MKAFIVLPIVLVVVFSLMRDASSYEIAYVRAPLGGPFPEVSDPIQWAGNSDLVLLRENGIQEVLVDVEANEAIDSPMMSIDGTRIYYGRATINEGSDIWVLDLATRQANRLTDGGSCSPTWNLHPQELPGDKVMYVSNSPGCYAPNKGFTEPNLRLTILDLDTMASETIGHLSIGSALHPTLLTNGLVMFSSYEAQGLRARKQWGLWAIYPDGRSWRPIMSAFIEPSSLHFQTETTDGSIVVTEYYNDNNGGFGSLLKMASPDISTGRPYFGSPNPAANPAIQRLNGKGAKPGDCNMKTVRYGFSPEGLQAVTPFAQTRDNDSCKDASGKWLGKVTMPKGAPGNSILVVWTGPNRPLSATRSGIYRIDPDASGGIPILDHPNQMVKVLDNAGWNEQFPIPVVAFADVYGAEPPELDYLPIQHASLQPGDPFGLVGTSSVCKHDADGVTVADNWKKQGGSVQLYGQGRYGCGNEEHQISAIRILAMEGATDRDAFDTHQFGPMPGIGLGERLRILGEIPLRKLDAIGNPVLDAEGNPDTSFLARIPADVAFTFQALDQNGDALNMAQTWHQVRPGEVRNDCGGCHAHSQMPLDFATTAASAPGYQIQDMALSAPLLSDIGPVVQPTPGLDVEWEQDGLEAALGMSYEAALGQSKQFNPLDSPLITALTGELRRKVSRWIALGNPRGAVWLQDEHPPSLALTNGIVGAYDLRGLVGPPVVTVDGNPVALTQLDANRWAYEGEGLVVATVEDAAGNVATLTRRYTAEPEPVPACTVTIDVPDDCEVTP